MEEKKVLRRSSNKMIAGVCSGLAEYFGMDPMLVRIIFVATALLGFSLGGWLYLILWVVLPAPDASSAPKPPAAS